MFGACFVGFWGWLRAFCCCLLYLPVFLLFLFFSAMFVGNCFGLLCFTGFYCFLVIVLLVL